MINFKRNRNNIPEFIYVDDYIIPVNNIQYIKKNYEKRCYTSITTYDIYFADASISFDKNAAVYHRYDDAGAYKSTYKVVNISEAQYNKLKNFLNNNIISLN